MTLVVEEGILNIEHCFTIFSTCFKMIIVSLFQVDDLIKVLKMAGQHIPEELLQLKPNPRSKI